MLYRVKPFLTVRPCCSRVMTALVGGVPRLLMTAEC
jgi:hypothetical protein